MRPCAERHGPHVSPPPHGEPEEALAVPQGHNGLSPAKGFPSFSRALSVQLREQRLGFLEVGRTKPFSKPGIDLSQQLPSFDPFALAPP
jgi:hypothetical protein